MSDIVGRLRDRQAFGLFPGDAKWTMLVSSDQDCQDAADEIERLREALTRIANFSGQISDAGWEMHGIANRVLNDPALTKGESE